MPGVPEVGPGDDLGALLVDALTAAGLDLRAGDCLAVSSKVVSKARGLTWEGERGEAVTAQTRRVVAERRGLTGVTRVVEAAAGPVMAAAGVDASNTGPGGQVLLLPPDPDAEAASLRDALRVAAGLPGDAALAVVLTDTAGRPWRAGLTDFALGAAGLSVLEDLRGGTDHDGRPLLVTARALADEVAAAADLVKGKADGVPAALVRGLPSEWLTVGADGARTLVRTGPGDWFALGHAEAVREALGVASGSAASDAVGIRSVAPEPLADRVGRVLALALHDVEDGSADVALGPDTAEVVLAAPDPFDAGRLVVRVQVAARSEDLYGVVVSRGADGTTVRLRDR
ncbi:coenzyme F420-0:L-glutamate ligase [Phycicoccus sp. CSK15P-2]|uniref:coenzyme F420-0:L-glutamate ligase n=1 Tax=Phycicoccus sp. CSK15P-2 TaxID=2807627 RepID=UPI0027DC7FFF|nr:coenzyme F420-0:L-glutamate ligase [Phycicoccus sp. CSK15P-2]